MHRIAHCTLRDAKNGMSSHISINVRCLLWTKRVPRGEWASELVRKTGIPLARINAFLIGDIDDANLNPQEVAMFAEVVGVGIEADNLRYPGYAFANSDLLTENLRYLLNTLGRGGKKGLAGEIGVDPTTLSRWLNGTFVPQTSTLRQLISHFGLPPNTNLEEDPIFLSAHPISAAERRNWLHERIEHLRSDELRDLFPALRRLLEER
jgi:transcriptional regulator with XRE-family HTH domain